MEKYNYLIDNAFMGLVMDETPNKFLKMEEKLLIDETPEIRKLKSTYREMIEEIKPQLEKLATIEEVITYLRVAEVAKTDVRLSNVRGYLYARTPLFRSLWKNKDFRTSIGKVSEYGDDLSSLKENDKFMEQATEKLQVAFRNEMETILVRAMDFTEKFQE